MRFNTDLFSGSDNSKAMAALGVIAGLLVAVYGGMDYMEQSERLQGAETINATVSDVDIEEQSSSSRRGPEMEYAPIVRFEYSYSGENYTSDNFYPTDTDVAKNNREKAEEITADFSTEDRITVFIDPENPGEAFLRNGRSSKPLILLGFGALMTLLASRSLIKY